MIAIIVRGVISSVVTCCFLLVSPWASAATRTWSGAVNGNWATAGNWDALPGGGDDLIFPEVALNKTNNNNLGLTVFNSITFTGTGYTISGNAIGVGAGGITQTLTTSLGNALNTDLSMPVAGITVLTTTSAALGNTLTLGGVISGGQLRVTGDGTVQTSVRLNGANTYSGGTILNSGFLIVGNDNAFGTSTVFNFGATINLNGHTVANSGDFQSFGEGGNGAVNGSGTWSGPVMLLSDTGLGTGGTLDFTGVISENEGPTTLTAPVAGSGGVVTLSNDNTYTGTTFVAGSGTLFINGSQPQSNVVVGAGSTLGGTGTVGTVTLNSSSARLAPGLSPGIINTNNLSIPAGSSYDVELNGTVVGSEYDQANVTGTVTLGGTLNVTLGFVPANGSIFTIINNDGTDPVSGTFSGLAQDATFVVNGVTFQISYAGGDGNDVLLAVLSPPVPPTAIADSTSTLVGAAGTFDVSTNDTKPAGATYSLAAGSTCAGSSVSGAGVAGYTAPNTVGATCTVNYQVCNPTPDSSTCARSALTVTAVAAATPPIAVPTVNEWWLMILMAVAGSGSIYYLRRCRSTVKI